MTSGGQIVAYLAVKNFEKHQHYKDRDPVWIKFYVAVLNDPDITRLSEGAQCQLFKFWLLASRHGNRIPFGSATDRAVVKSAVAPTAKLRLAELQAAGLIYEVYKDASTTLDESYGLNARGRALAEEVEEVRGERLEQANRTTTTARENSSIEWTDGERAVFGAVTDTKRQKLEFMFAAWRQGTGMPGGRPADPQDISAGLIEFMSNHDETPDFKAAHMISYVTKARDRRLSNGTPTKPRGGSFLEVA